MTSSAWADALLIAVLLAPLVTVVLALAVAVPNVDPRWTTGGCVIAAAGAAVLLVAGQHPQVSRLAPDDLALAGAIASAGLALSVRSSLRTPVVATMVTVVICGLAAGSPGDPSIVGPVLALSAGVALLALTRDGRRPTLAALGAGAVAIAAGARAGGDGGAVAVVAGVALVGTVASLSTRRAATVLVPVALVLGLRVGPALAGTSAARPLAVALGLAGAGLALLPFVAPGCGRWARGSALVPWTLAAAVGPLAGTPVAARALAAGVVIVLVLGGPLAVLSALPGAALLVYAVADGNGWPRPVLGLLFAVTVLGLTYGHEDPAAFARVRVVDALALATGVWLVVLPETWGWMRVEGLRTYTDGTALATAVAVAAATLYTITGGRLAAEPFVRSVVAGDEHVVPQRVRVDVVMVVAVVLMGLVAAALVRSPGL